MGNKKSSPCHPRAGHSDTKETCPTERRVEELVAVEESIRALPCHFQLSCTRSREKPICQLLGQLQAYNDVLWYLGLQLREDETGDVGSLRLVVSSPLTRRWTQKSASLAIRLLVVLFTRHRCLLHVDLTEDIVRNPVLRQSLTNSPGVKKVHVCCYDAIASKVDGIDDLVFRLIPSLEQIEELAFRSRGIRSPSYVTADVFGLKRPDTRLTTIDIAELKLNQPTANRFVAHLARNRIVTSLAVGHEIFSLASFAEYLGKNKPALKRLALRSGRVCNPAVMKRLAGAISTMTALEELTVAVNFTSPQEVGIFAEVVARNKTIKVMSLTQPSTTSDHELPDYSDLSIASLPGTAEAWQPALKENCVLKELTIDFLGFQESDCHCFFRALKENKALLKVTVLNLPTQGDLKAICSTIRHCGLTDKVQITRIHLDSTSIPKLEYCPEVTAVSLSTFSPEMNLPKALGVLDSCGHASSVCLDMDEKFFESTVHGSLSEFIEMADNLTELRLRLHARFSAEMHLGHRVAQSTVVKAISSCTSLTMLELVGFYLANSDCRMLAEAAVRSPYLHHLEVNCHKGNLHFLQHLARIVACSYSLIHVQVPYCDEADQEHFAIQETTRRNSSLIIRAARFVLGDKTTYCARALELVSRHPKLVEMVEDRAAITCGEAKEMIRRALLNIADMDGFMRAAGIVRDKVKCDGDPDGQKQLDQLGDDCWSHVRIYLKISDVLEPPL